MAEVMTAASMNVVDTEHNLDEFPHKFNDADYDHAVKVALPVVVAKVDCVDHFSLCQKENIRMYPTLRLFIDGKPWQGGSDYKGHRTVMEVCVCVCVCVCVFSLAAPYREYLVPSLCRGFGVDPLPTTYLFKVLIFFFCFIYIFFQFVFCCMVAVQKYNKMVDWLKHMEEQHKSAMNSDGEKGNTMRKLHTAHESAKEYMGIDSDASSKADDVTNKRNTKKRLYNEWRDAEHPGTV